MKITISDRKANREFYNVPAKVAKAIITLLNECGNDESEILTAESEMREFEYSGDCISREQAKAAIRTKFKDLPSRIEINTILNELPSCYAKMNEEEQ